MTAIGMRSIRADATGTAIALTGAGGLVAWVLFLAVAALSPSSGASVDPSVLYAAEPRFVVELAVRNGLICAGAFAAALVLSRHPGPRARTLAGAAAAIVLGAWTLRAGLDAAELGLAHDVGALAAATAPHAIPELGLVALPCLWVAAGRRPGRAVAAICGLGLIACALLEALA